MKVVDGALVREKYQPPSHPANHGDSCAESSRYVILDNPPTIWLPSFVVPGQGYVRHPSLRNLEGWGVSDFSNDQALPYLMALDLVDPIAASAFRRQNRIKLMGTKTYVSIGVWALVRKQYWLLNIANIVQGLLFNVKYRIGDEFKVEKSEGQVQDWINYAITYIFLKKIGNKATLNQPVEKVMAAIRKYYLEGPDAEPNSHWIVNFFEKNLT